MQSLTVSDEPIVFAVQSTVADQQNLVVQMHLVTDAGRVIVDTIRVVRERLDGSAEMVKSREEG